MGKYDNGSPHMTLWTNWKLMQTIKPGIASSEAEAAWAILERRVVRRRPDEHPNYDERGRPIRT